MPHSNDPTGLTLADLTRDAAVTSITVRGAVHGARDPLRASIVRSGTSTTEPVTDLPDSLAQLIADLLGEGRTAGRVTLHGLAGFAALPPVSEVPFLALEREARAARGAADPLVMPPSVAAAIGTLLGYGGGAILAAHPGVRLREPVSDIVRRIPERRRVVVVEDGLRVSGRPDACRLRDLPPLPRRALGAAVLIVAVGEPPSIADLSPPALITVTARSPEAALARLTVGTHAASRSSVHPGVLWADTAPLLVWLAPTQQGPRLAAAYALLPTLRSTGVPELHLLAAIDPVTQALISTGILPRDDLLRAVWVPVHDALSAHPDGS